MEETPIADYLDKEVPDSMKDEMIAGMTMRIGVAVSQDGVTYGRVEGDHYTGAIVAPEGDELYCAWPEVVLDLEASETNKPETFKMWYSTMTKDKRKCLAFATSEDGFRWKKLGFCLEPDADGPDAAGCARCCVVRDASFDEEEGWKDLSGWKMYYEGVSPIDNKHRIMIAESSNGKSWVKKGLAFDVGAEDAFDVAGVGAPHVLRMDDGQMRMYYVGQAADGTTAIGVAKLQTESNEWVREQASIVFS